MSWKQAAGLLILSVGLAAFILLWGGFPHNDRAVLATAGVFVVLLAGVWIKVTD